MANSTSIKLLLESLLEHSDIRMFSMIQERSGSTLLKLRLDIFENGGHISEDQVRGGGTSRVYLT